MSNYFTMYKIVAVLAFAYRCAIRIVYTISVYYFSIMVAEKGRVAEKGHIQIFRLILLYMKGAEKFGKTICFCLQ